MTKPLADLPNRHGFKFTAILKTGARVACIVGIDPATGLHSIAGASFSEILGWVEGWGKA